MLCYHSTTLPFPYLISALALLAIQAQTNQYPLRYRVAYRTLEYPRTRKPTRHQLHEYLENCVGFARDYAEWPHPSTWAVVRHESPTLGVDEACWPQHTVNSQARIL